MSKQKIAYISHTSLISGAEVSLLTLLSELDRDHFEPVLIAPAGGKLNERAAELSVPVFTLGKGQFFEKPGLVTFPTFLIQFISKIWVLSQLLRKQQIHLIHANSVRAGLVAVFAAYLAGKGIRVITHVRDLPEKKFWLQRISIVCLGLFSTQLICISKNVAGAVEQQLPNFLTKKIKVIYNGLRISNNLSPITSRNNYFRQEMGVANDGKLLGVVAQLTPWKGQFEALTAFAHLIQSSPETWKNTKLVIVGEAKFVNPTARYNTMSYRSDLQNFVGEKGLSNQVIFTGERSDIPAIMAALDLLIVPSWQEPFGRVVIEAMEAGTAVLATRAGGIPEIIEHRKTGWLVEPRNSLQLAQGIATLMNRSELREKLEFAAQIEVRNRFALSVIMRQVEEVYTSILFRKQETFSLHKVLYVNHTGQMSGAEISLLRTLKNLDHSDFAATLACPEGSPLWQAGNQIESLELVDLEPFTFSYRLKPATLKLIWRSCLQITRIVRKVRPGIIHANSIRSGIICSFVKLFLLISFSKSPKLVVHLRDDLGPGIINWAVRLLLSTTSSKLLPVSKYVERRTRLLPWNINDQYEVLHDGVDPLEFNPNNLNQEDLDKVRAEFDLDEACYPVIGVVGQITPWKGHAEAIKGFSEVVKNYPEARLLIVGEPRFTGNNTRYNTRAYFENLKQLTTDLGLSGNVVFTSHYDNMPVLMGLLDIFLLCSWAEPFGLVYIEAMAMEKPVVATEKGGPEEIIVHGKTGMKVPPHQPEIISQALLYLTSHPDEAKKMGQLGRERVLNLFTVNNQTHDLENIYKALEKV